jgi:hypothetical protein
MFWLKFNLFVLAVLVFIGCWAFLFNLHADNLDKYVPAEAETYAHFNSKVLSKVPEEQKAFYLDWLAQQSTISAENWEQVLKLTRGEIGLFTINGQVFSVIKPRNKVHDFLNKQKIMYSGSKSVTYFPSLTAPTQVLAEEEWYKQTKNKINFADFVIYSESLAKSATTIPLLNYEELYPLAILGNFGNKTLNLTMKGNVGQAKTALLKPQIEQIPDSAKLYFRNFSGNSLIQMLPKADLNYDFAILQKLTGPIEYLQTESGSIIYALADLNDAELIKAYSAETLAHLSPSERAKELPDGTAAIHLIADPAVWTFEINDNNVANIKHVNDLDLGYEIGIKQTAEYIMIQNSEPSLDAAAVATSCSYNSWKPKTSIYIQPEGNIFSNIVITNKNQTTIGVCID